MKRIVHKLFCCICQLIVLLARKAKALDSLIYHICLYYEKYSSNFIRYRLIPKYSSSVNDDRLKTNSTDKSYGIIIQGQLISKNDFTLETIRIYKKIFPHATIIVSTWEGEDRKLLKDIENEGCKIILNAPPSPMGLCHVNYQIVSTQMGLKKAKELGLKFCLKNRSDIRLNYKYSLEYLASLLSVFKVGGSALPLKGRIISLNGIPGQMFFPFWIQDYCYFGYTDDLVDFFDIELDKRNQHNSGIRQLGEDGMKNGKDFYKHISPEMYIVLTYLRKYANIETLMVKDSWEYIRRYFLTVNFEDLNVLWDKYDRLWMNKFMGEYDGNKTYDTPYMPLTFQNFVNLYNNQFDYTSDIEDLSEGYTQFII